MEREGPGPRRDREAPHAPQLRLFTAVEVPSPWRDALKEQARRLESAAPGFGRWVDPALMHITLVFLGAQPESQLPTIKDAMHESAATTAPFEVGPGRFGVFGSLRSVRVVWAGVEDHPKGALASLHDRLADSLRRGGVAFDATPFRTHITLARARRDATPAGSELMHHAVVNRRWEPTPEAFDCQSIALIRSDLRPSGPIYTPLHHESLAGPAR